LGRWPSVAGIAAALFVVATMSLPAQDNAPSAAELMDDLMWGRTPIGGPFDLIDQTGRRRTDADFRGKLLLLYFGYTYCPDVCPTDLMAIAAAVDQLGPAGENIQPLFITIDPERDTVEQLAGYVGAFHSPPDRPHRTARTDSQGRARLQSLLRKSAGPGRDRLRDRPYELHLSGRPRREIPGLLSAQYAGGAAGRDRTPAPVVEA
jgi:cytochrome oxidase Cu insertion factor (SCO1/SenC/PrrC family)